YNNPPTPRLSEGVSSPNRTFLQPTAITEPTPFKDDLSSSNEFKAVRHFVTGTVSSSLTAISQPFFGFFKFSQTNETQQGNHYQVTSSSINHMYPLQFVILITRTFRTRRTFGAGGRVCLMGPVAVNAQW